MSLPASPVPPTILDEARTVTGALSALAERFPDFACLTIADRRGGEQRLTLGRLWARAGQIASHLLGRGLAPGRIVLLTLPTGPELLAAYFGVMRAGAVPGLVATPSNRFADPEVYCGRLLRLAEHADAQLLYGDDDVAELLRTPAAAGARTADLVLPSDSIGAAAVPGRPAVESDIATVQYSSGSTGLPKGVLLSHRAVLNNLRASRQGFALSGEDVSVNWLPLYHDMGLIDAFLLPLLSGGRTVLIPTMDFMRDPAHWLRCIHRYGGTFSIAPNFAFSLCAARIPAADLDGLDLSTWRLAISASEPVLAETIEAFVERFTPYGLRPETLTPGWGLAEGVCVITLHELDAPPAIEIIDRSRLASNNEAIPLASGGGLPSVSCGRCLPRCEIEIRDRSGRRLDERKVGTIWLKTDSLFTGYHRDPQSTARVLVDGWLDTGDRGYLAGGNLYFVSREKDLIVIGGEKYAPHDVETAINRVAGVRQGCAVAFGVLNERRGTEDLAAVVETKTTDQNEIDQMRRAIRTEVTRATGLGLRFLLLVPPGGVEKTTSGKLARRATQNRYRDRLLD
jgi:acyl-CoA synthetase (AMP-forming)/AMP-acid ligase II